jgi:protein kinase-like protein
MARVYRAEHEGLQRQVALKVLLDGQGKASDGHERFLREARIAAAIKHPNVVNIFDVGVHQGTPYLVMELLEGVDLDAFVEAKTRLDEATIMDIVVPIAGALAAVHDAGIVHRDLKPGNIFLARGRNDEIEPRLLDFGISKSTGPDQMRLTSARGQVLGTPFYMSPEAARGAEMTPLSDQYALGLVLYECATGVNPFTPAGSFVELVQRVTTGDFQPVSSHNAVLSKRMVAIIERAMQLDPARRFPDMRAMGRELLLLAGQRTRITWGLSFNELAAAGALAKLPLHGKSRAPQSSRRARHVGIAALALAALLGGGYTATQRQRDGDFGATARVVTAPASRAEDTARTPNSEPRTARVSPPELAANGEFAPAPADPTPQEPEHAAAQTVNVSSEAAAHDPASARPVSPIAIAVGQALRKPQRAPGRVTRTRRSAESAPALTTAAAPEWIADGTPNAAGDHGDHGTNNAPIFD